MQRIIPIAAIIAGIFLLRCGNEYPLSVNQTQASPGADTSKAVSTPQGDTLVWSGEKTLSTSQTIPAGATYWCAPGTQLFIPPKGTLAVKGTLIVAGSSASPVQIFCPMGSSISISGKLIGSYLISNGYSGTLFTGAGGACQVNNAVINGYTKVFDGVFDSLSVSNSTFTGNTNVITIETITGVSANGATLSSMNLSGIQITGSGNQSGTGISINGNTSTNSHILLQQTLFGNLAAAFTYSIPTAGASLIATNVTVRQCTDAFLPLTANSQAFDTIVISDVNLAPQDTALLIDSIESVNQLIVQNANVTSQTVPPVLIGKTAPPSLQFNHVTLADKNGIPYNTAQIEKNVCDTTKFKVLVLDSILGSSRGAGYQYVSVVSPLSVPSDSLSLPATPVISSVTAADGSVTLTWDAANGASTYNIRYEAGKTIDNNAAKISSVLSPKTITGLADGTLYSFALSSVNTIGESGLSTVVTATPLAITSAPTNVVATASDGSITVTWGAVNGATSYNLYYAAGTTVEKTSAEFPALTTTTKTLKGLTNGTAYSIAVTAVNAIGESSLSTVIQATPFAAAGIPSILTLTPYDDSVAVSWTAVTGATSYNLYYAPGKTVDKNAAKLSVSGVQKTVTGLINGTQYAFAVSSVNAGGESNLSQVGTSTPVAIPQPPTISSAVAGDGNVVVTWATVPGANSYNLYYASGNKIDTTAAKFTNLTPAGNSGGASVTKTISSLANGTNYIFAITAVNSSGQSPLSASVSAMPVSTPSAPAIPALISLSPYDDSVAVSWTAVTGATSFNLYYAPGKTVDKNAAKLSVSSAQKTVTGLINGTQYAFAVSSVNASGESNLSPVGTSTPVAIPQAPTISAAVAGDGNVVVTWATVPGANSYNLYYASGNKIDTTAAKFTNLTPTGNSGGTSVSKTVGSLTNGANYTFAVAAVNSSGQSPLSAPVSAMPVSTPSAPAVPVLSAGDGYVVVNWSSVNQATSYNLYYAVGSSAKNGTKVACASTSDTVKGLTDGVQYAFAISAVDANGESALSQSSTATPIAAPVPPILDTIIAADDSLTIQWEQASGASSYNLYYSEGTSVNKTSSARYTSVSSPFTLKGLANGIEYAIAVTSVNASGESQLSSIKTGTPVSLPAAPTGLTVKDSTAGTGLVKLSWNPVAGATSYNIYYAIGTSVDKSGSEVTVASNPTTKVLQLSSGDLYAIKITAINAQGESALSSVATTTAP